MKEFADVILLVGAGASQSLNIPAMGGMFHAFLQKRRSGISAENNRVCKLLVEQLGIHPDLEEFLLAANAIIDSQDKSLWKLTERIVSPSMKSSKIAKYREKLRKHVSDIQRTRKSILDFMSKTCFKFNKEEASRMLSGIVSSVSERGYPVYTTNYDFSFEYAAGEQDIAVHDNFLAQGRRLIWNPEIKYPLGNALTIIKLHGSVTWYSDDRGVIEKIESHTTINPAGRSVDRLVIFPTRFKDIYDQHFFSLYSHFLEALSAAKCLVIIGHSLRDEYIQAAIIERFRKKVFSIVVVDPQWPKALPGELRPARVGTAADLTHIPLKFEDFADELSHVLRTDKPEAVAKACAAVFRQMKHKKSKLRIKGNIRVLKPGQTKQFVAAVNAYVHRHQRPVCVRAWLEASYRKPSGEKREECTPKFLNPKEHLSLGLSGILKADVPIAIKVPNIPTWLEHAKKVQLYVALLAASHRSPHNLTRDTPIAADSRVLSYVP
jgi:NAD-dependent SIR2 family protein deacetylase